MKSVTISATRADREVASRTATQRKRRDRSGKTRYDTVLSYSTPMPGDWIQQGACRDIGAGFFDLMEEEAKAICARCPVVDQCLEYALETRQDSNVFGGMSSVERRRLMRRRQRS